MSAATVSRPSVNRLAASLVERLIRDAEALRIDVEHDAAGASGAPRRRSCAT